MKYSHIRHATGILTYKGIDILIDPMLADKGSLPPIKNSSNPLKNPLTALPFEKENFPFPSHTLITHLHFDHFDQTAIALMPKETTILCQEEDAQGLRYFGFRNLIEIKSEATLGNIRIERVSGEHGTGAIGKAMGISSGYVLTAENEPTLYITGDTIYCDSIHNTLARYQPDIILAFAGSAVFSEGDPITLSAKDILSIHTACKNSTLICTHMDAINHCALSRPDLQKFLIDNHLPLEQFFLPENGETLMFHPI